MFASNYETCTAAANASPCLLIGTTPTLHRAIQCVKICPAACLPPVNQGVCRHVAFNRLAVKLTEPLIPGLKPTWPLRLTTLSCLLLLFYFVPISRTCNTRIRPMDKHTTTVLGCIDPEFVVICKPGSLLANQDTYRCRTRIHRPVVVRRGHKLRLRRCRAELGDLASYGIYRGCFCDYYSEEIDNLCRMTDATCIRLHGSGSYASINSAGLGDGCSTRI